MLRSEGYTDMAGELVLVIDDSPTITKVVQLVLTKAGYQVQTAPDGEAGLEAIRAQLTVDDVLMTGPDKGIFDALNKGLERCDTAYMGWLGSDDLFTGRLKASEVVRELGKHELFLANMVHFRGERATRMTFARPAAAGLVKYAFNNPHFATFGRSTVFKSERFLLGLRASDIDYFLRIFAHRRDISWTRTIGVASEEGGFSSESPGLVLKSNLRLVRVHAAHTGVVIAFLSVLLKLVLKSTVVIRYRVQRVDIRSFLTFDPGPL